MPTGILYLVKGSPPVVRVTAHEPDEAKMHTVSALIHSAGDGVVRCWGGQVRFCPTKPVALHVLDDFLNDRPTLVINNLRRVCFCLDFIMVSFPGKLIEIIR